MTTHELARLLLEGPNQLVAIAGHEPNDDQFDPVERVDHGEAWEYAGDLYDGPPLAITGRRMTCPRVPITVIR